MMRILLIEDDSAVQQFVEATLHHAQIETVITVNDAVERARKASYDLVLVDILLGQEDGIEAARRIRGIAPFTAIVILTAHGSLQTAIHAIELNAQAYLLKPVKPAELRAVAKEQVEKMRLMRQKHELADQVQRAVASLLPPVLPEQPPSVLISGSLRLNRERYEAEYDGRDLQLSPAQFRVLWLLAAAGGVPVSSIDMVQEALGYQVSEVEAGDLIKGHISHIRRKLMTCEPHKEHIITIRGQGYLWVD